jgi:hypothetical protein
LFADPTSQVLQPFETRVCRFCITKALRLLLFVLGLFVRYEGFHQQDEVLRRALLEVSSDKTVAVEIDWEVWYAKRDEVK